MRLEICLPLALLFLINGVPSDAQKTDAAGETAVSVAAGAPLTVVCALRVEQRAVWRLNDGEVPGDLRPAGESPAGDGRLVARLHAPAARAAHAGLYTCSRQPGAARVRVRVLLAPGESSVSAADATPEVVLDDDWFRPRGADSDFYREPLYYDVKGLLQLNCTAPGHKLTGYKWSKNGTKLSAVRELNAPAARYQLLDDGGVLRLEHAHEDDYGNYSCLLVAAGWRRDWDVRGRPVARLPPDSNVVEGQKIKIQCRIIGKPYPRVTWLYKNASSEEGNGTSLEGDARFALEDSEAGVRGGALVLLAARRGDQGRYECMPAAGDGVAAATTLRVKDMYAALWPFLGICAEVFVLCGIILVYEKRRTKPELDDSDTDNHDQKKS